MRVTAPDRTEIACYVSGEGPPLVLVHGTTADHTRWDAVLDSLGERHTVYTIDRRGRGGSTDADPYSIEHEFDDVAAVVEAIGGPVDLLGHSYGAVCSLEAALRTDVLRRLILYEPPLPIGIEIYPPALLDELDRRLEAGDRDGVVATFMQQVVRVPADQLDALRADPSWPGRIAAAHTIARELRIGDNYTPDFNGFASIRVPTLLMVGGDSPPFLVEPSQKLSEVIPDSTLVSMPGQQHVAMTTAPELFLGHVEDFLAG